MCTTWLWIYLLFIQVLQNSTFGESIQGSTSNSSLLAPQLSSDTATTSSNASNSSTLAPHLSSDAATSRSNTSNSSTLAPQLSSNITTILINLGCSSQNPPLCCTGISDRCRPTNITNCHCDSACTHFKDCCSDYTKVCVNACQNLSCNPNATCQWNTISESYTCICKPGFSGNGTSCTDINECAQVNCTSNAVCKNTIGSYNCVCKDGFTGNGASCVDIDECLSIKCSPNCSCQNTEGSYNCVCKDSYGGSNSTNSNTSSTQLPSRATTVTATLSNIGCSSQNPPLCCAGVNMGCTPKQASCHCDVACDHFQDCCPDYKQVCVTGSNSKNASISDAQLPSVTAKSTTTTTTLCTNCANALNCNSMSCPSSYCGSLSTCTVWKDKCTLFCSCTSNACQNPGNEFYPSPLQGIMRSVFMKLQLKHSYPGIISDQNSADYMNLVQSTDAELTSALAMIEPKTFAYNQNIQLSYEKGITYVSVEPNFLYYRNKTVIEFLNSELKAAIISAIIKESNKTRVARALSVDFVSPPEYITDKVLLTPENLTSYFNCSSFGQTGYTLYYGPDGFVCSKNCTETCLNEGVCQRNNTGSYCSCRPVSIYSPFGKNCENLALNLNAFFGILFGALAFLFLLLLLIFLIIWCCCCKKKNEFLPTVDYTNDLQEPERFTSIYKVQEKEKNYDEWDCSDE